MPGKNEENGKQAGSPSGNTATAVRGRVKGKAAVGRRDSIPALSVCFAASFPEGKPARARFETHVGLTDKKVLGTNDSIHKQEGSPSGELRDSGERALKKLTAVGRRDSIPCPFRPFGPASPRGKPARGRFEAHVGLTDQRNSGQMTLSVRTSPPKCGGLREAVGGCQAGTSRK